MTKTFLKGALLAAVALTATPSFAGNNPETFTATAVIQKPLSITKVADLDFGITVMNPSLVSASVSVDKSSGAQAVCSSAQLTCNGGAPAELTVNGVGSQSVDLSFSTLTSLDDGFGNSVPFTLDNPTSVAMTNGVGTFYVGGSIDIDASTVDGSYSGDIDVTASYQ